MHYLLIGIATTVTRSKKFENTREKTRTLRNLHTHMDIKIAMEIADKIKIVNEILSYSV